MRQHGAARLHPGDPGQRLLEMAVRHMRRAADAVDDPEIDAVERRKRGGVELDHVGRIGEAAETEAERGREAMTLREGRDGDAGRLERPVDEAALERRLIEARARVRIDRREDVAEALLDLGHGRGICKERDRPPHQPVDGAQIVDTMQVVGMGMGEQHGVERGDAGIEQLLAQIGRGVDEEPRPALLHHHRAAPPAVARVPQIAGAPLAADARHAPGRAAAQHRYAHETAAGRRALSKSRKKFSLVAWASAATETPLSSASSAAVWTMKAGSLRLPRIGTGAR